MTPKIKFPLLFSFSYSVFMLIAVSGAATAQEDLLKGLQEPPARLPSDLPKLLPLLVNDAGKAITTKEAWGNRRDVLKRKWQDFMGKFPEARAPLKAQVVTTEDLPDFTRQHVRYQIEDGVFTDGYLLTPTKLEGKLPAMVVFHQTVNTQARQPAGLDQSNPELIQGVQLAKRGYVVLCPRCFIFDEFPESLEYPESHRHWEGNVRKVQARHPNWVGMARMTYDGVRAVDYLESLPNVDEERIGCIGHSLGAKEVLYAAAFDERYKVAVFSEGGIGLRTSNWDAPWYLGGGIYHPDFNMENHQVLSLIAPRPFLFLAGDAADKDTSWAFVNAVIPIYRLLGAADKLGWLNHRTGHRYPPNVQAVTEAFIDRFLKP